MKRVLILLIFLQIQTVFLNAMHVETVVVQNSKNLVENFSQQVEESKIGRIRSEFDIDSIEVPQEFLTKYVKINFFKEELMEQATEEELEKFICYIHEHLNPKSFIQKIKKCLFLLTTDDRLYKKILKRVYSRHMNYRLDALKITDKQLIFIVPLIIDSFQKNTMHNQNKIRPYFSRDLFHNHTPLISINLMSNKITKLTKSLINLLGSFYEIQILPWQNNQPYNNKQIQKISELFPNGVTLEELENCRKIYQIYNHDMDSEQLFLEEEIHTNYRKKQRLKSVEALTYIHSFERYEDSD